MGNAPPADMSNPINLMRGWPHPSLLPIAALRTAAATVLSHADTAHDGLLYGPDPGYGPAREAIADWLTTFYRPHHAVTPARLCITGGASQNLGCLLNVYTDPSYTRHIWIVAPAYMLAFRIFEDAGFAGRMRAVPEDDEGVDVDFLRREMERSEEEARRRKGFGWDRPLFKPERQRAKVYKHVVYCVPSFANPSSKTMSLRRRRQLVRVAREFDALVVPDEVYDFLQWPASSSSSSASATVKTDAADEAPSLLMTAHLPRLVDVDRELEGGPERPGADGFGNACSNASFSKIAGPGLRVGWCEGTEKFAYGVSQTGTTASGGAPSQLSSTYLAHLLRTEALQTHLHTHLLPAYARRHAILQHAIKTYLLPLGFTLPEPVSTVVGGYFIWLVLPPRLNATALAQRCAAQVVIAAGPVFAVPGDDEAGKGMGFEGCVRLCFAWEEEENLREGVRRVGLVAKGMLEQQQEEEGGEEEKKKKKKKKEEEDDDDDDDAGKGVANGWSGAKLEEFK